MPIDASIPLQVQGPQPITLNSLAQMAQMRQQIQDQRQARAVQNSLAAIYANPGNLGPDGLPNDEAVRQISAISPQLGIDLQSKRAKIDADKALIQERAWKVTADKTQMIHDKVLDASMVAYESARANGLPEQQARMKGQEAYSAGLASLKQSGQFSDQETAQMPASFDPDRVRPNTIKYKDLLANMEKQKSDDRADRREANVERHQMVTEAQGASREERIERELAKANQKPDAGGGVAGFTPEEIDLLARKDKAGLPLNLSRGKSMDPVRKAIVDRQVQIAKEEGGDNQSAVESMQQGKADTAAIGKAVRDFSTGKQGDTVRSINVSMNHLDTMRNVANALQNGDVKMFNQFSQKMAEETGHTAPTDFDAVKQIVGDELIKGIIGAGGGQGDREEVAANLSKAKSPAQLVGVMDRYQELLGGQLKGIRQQYKASTKRDDFNDRLLSPRARQIVGADEDAGSKGKSGGKTLTYDPATGTFK